jgi:tetratricopeptide (TPR) repeat protein
LRALALVSPEVERDQPASVVGLEAAPFYEAWARRDFGTAAQQADLLKNKAGLRTGDLRQATIYSLCEELLILGRLHELEQWAALMSDPGEKAFAKAALAEERQDVRATRAAVLEQLRLRTSVGPNTVARLARSGLVPQAQAALPMISGRPYPADADFATGEIALAQGRLPEAVARLSAAVEGFREHDIHYRLIAAVALAKALERQGKTEEAIRVLAHEVESDVPYGGKEARLRLARLYRMQGRPKEAEEQELAVRQSLAYADPDHPLLALLNSHPTVPEPRMASR